jgi:hypothetical protein
MCCLRSRITVVCAIAAAIWGCAGSSPVGPGSSGTASVDVTCPASIVLGQIGVCALTAHLQAGGTSVVTQSATWTSSDPSIATVILAGSLRARMPGTVSVSASYQGLSARASMTIVAEDVLHVDASANQGTFRAGSTVTLWLLGFYGVASADAGQLNLVVTDQNGAIVSATAPQMVLRGGDGFNLSTTFVIPDGTTRMCRAAVLQIGSLKLTDSGNAQLFPCLDVAP